jgi:signal transduction histidine kinase
VIHKHQRVDGGRLDVEIYAAPMHVDHQGVPQLLVVESIRDLGQQVKFSHEQKLSELGRLAAGVAHEIHNPLASIRLALHAARQANGPQSPDPHQVADYLSMVDQEIDSCIQVTERMLKLSMPPPAQPELIELDRVIGETLTLLRWEAETRSARIELELRDTPLRIMATDSELRMATLNLAQNALHAMPDGGELRVSCGRRDGRVEVEFADTGIGIQAEDLERIFEPFFSRRADGVRGTGLGLSITKTIVENHRGSIAVESAPGRGSRFSIRFPDADA